jgi:hypothetical protein
MIRGENVRVCVCVFVYGVSDGTAMAASKRAGLVLECVSREVNALSL